MSAQPCRVSDVSDLGDASLSYSSLKGWDKLGKKDQFADLMDSCWRTRAYGDFWSYMLVAEGAVDVAAEPELNLYDMAALAIIVDEAGGKFTSLDGTPGPSGPNAVATNGNLHAEVLRRLS
jgi:histidinol-phosphatase